MPVLAGRIDTAGQSARVGLPAASLVYLPVVTLPRVTVVCSCLRFDATFTTDNTLHSSKCSLTLITCPLRSSYCGGMNQRLT